MVSSVREKGRFERALGSLVHGSVEPATLAFSRHQSFIVSHFLSGAAALLAGLAIFAVLPQAAGFYAIALGWLAVPLLIALYVWRSGHLTAGYLLSSTSLIGIATYMAVHTGGLSSFALIWLAIAPAEAALSGSRRVIVTTLALACASLGGLAYADIFSLLPVSLVPVGLESDFHAASVLVAACYLGGVALGVHNLHIRSIDALSVSERRYRLLAENASDLITRHNSNGEVVFASGATHTLLGCGPLELLDEGLLARVHPGDRIAYLTAFASSFSTGKAASAEFRILHRKGLSAASAGKSGPENYIWVEMRCRPVAFNDIPGQEAAQEPAEIVAVTRDISDLKAQQGELLEARDTAEKANRAKTFFLANISHELRTPLNAIIGFSEILRSEIPAEAGYGKGSEYAGLIHQSGSHLLHVVNDLLDMSKIESGKMEISPESFDLREVVDSCVRFMSPAALELGVHLDIRFLLSDPQIVADQRTCRQMLLNLLSNAIKFSERDGKVTVDVQMEDDDVVIRIIDQGIGIPASVLPRLGTPFTQSEISYNRTHEGTGLGLSVVKGLASLHGGELRIESTEGVGTVASIRLPRDCEARKGGPEQIPGPDQGDDLRLAAGGQAGSP